MTQYPTECTCRRCGSRLDLRRTWSAVLLDCRFCGAQYRLSDYRESISDVLEEFLARTPCDRL